MLITRKLQLRGFGTLQVIFYPQIDHFILLIMSICLRRSCNVDVYGLSNMSSSLFHIRLYLLYLGQASLRNIPNRQTSRESIQTLRDRLYRTSGRHGVGNLREADGFEKVLNFPVITIVNVCAISVEQKSFFRIRIWFLAKSIRL